MTTQKKYIALNCGGSYVPRINAVSAGVVLAERFHRKGV